MGYEKNNFVIYLPEGKQKSFQGELFDLFKNTSLPATQGLKGSVVLWGVDNQTAAKVKTLIPKECKMSSFLESHELVNGQGLK